MSRLVVDIGRYLTSYTVISSDNLVNYFSVENTNGNDIYNIVSDNSFNFVKKILYNTASVFNKSANYVGEDRVKYVDIIVPSKDILIERSAPITEETIRNFIFDTMKLTEDDELLAGISRPYKSGSKYYAPLTIYDENIFKLIRKLKIEMSEVAEVRMFSTLSMLVERASRTEGRAILVDASFSGVKVLYAEDGVASEFFELNPISGKTLLELMITKDSTLKSVRETLESLGTDREKQSQELVAAKTYLEDMKNRVFLPSIKEYNPDCIYVFGGLSNSILFKEIPYNVENGSNIFLGETTPVNSLMSGEYRYKAVSSYYLPMFGELNSNENIETLAGRIDFKEYLKSSVDVQKVKEIVSSLSTDAVLEDKNLYSPEIIRYMESGMSINSQKYRKVLDTDNLMKSRIYTETDESPYYEVIEKEEGNILNYHGVSEEDIKLKKKLKKFNYKYNRGTIKYKIPMILLTVVLSIIILVQAHISGTMNIPLLDKIGISGDINSDIKYDTIKTLLSRYDSMKKLSGSSPNLFTHAVIPTDKNLVEIVLFTPPETIRVDNMDEFIEKGFLVTDYKGKMSIERVFDENETDINIYRLKYDISFKYEK